MAALFSRKEPLQRRARPPFAGWPSARADPFVRVPLVAMMSDVTQESLGHSVSGVKPEIRVHYARGETRPARQYRRLPVLWGHPSSGACRHGGPRSPVPARWPATAARTWRAGCPPPPMILPPGLEVTGR